MDDIKRHLAAQAAKCERLAARFDTNAVEYQQGVAFARVQAGQERAKAAEFRRLLSTYGDAEQFQPDGLTGTWQEGNAVEQYARKVRDQASEGVGIGAAVYGEVGASAAGWEGVWLRDVELNLNQRFNREWPRCGALVLVPFDRMSEYQKIGRPKAPEAQEATEGVGGRKVQHVDVPEQQDAVSELPAAVWVPYGDTSPMLREMASDRREDGSEFLIQVALLTPEQKLKYGVGS